MPDHAVAALLLSDRPELTSLVRVATRAANRGIRRAQLDVYLTPHQGETMVAVVVDLKNPRDEETWEPREAQVKTAPPLHPATVRKAVRWLSDDPSRRALSSSADLLPRSVGADSSGVRQSRC